MSKDLPLKYSHGEFLIKVEDAKLMRKLVKAGWKYDGDAKLWYTPDIAHTLIVEDLAVGKARKKIKAYRSVRKKDLAPSLKLDSDIQIPKPDGKDYLGFQKAGIEYASVRKNTLIADPPGLGKTIQAIGFANLIAAKKILIICPASLKDNWVKEWKAWDVNSRTISIPLKKTRQQQKDKVIIRRWTENIWEDTDVHVISYGMVSKFEQTHPPEPFDLLIIDEAHYLKNDAAQRTSAIWGTNGKWVNKPNHKMHVAPVAPIEAERTLALTGTPIGSRPSELWVFCKQFDPDGLGKNKRNFEKRYCNAWHSPWGWETGGESNLQELQERLRLSFMVRRSKEEALPDLLPKRRQIIELPNTGASKKLLKSENDAVRNLLDLYELNIDENPDGVIDYMESHKKKFRFLQGEGLDDQIKHMKTDRKYAFQEIADIRKELALIKAPMVCEFVDNLIDAEEQVLLFCYHKDTAAHYKEYYPKCAFMTGLTPVGKRQAEVDRFQDNVDCNPFVGGITAAGVGHTLHASQLPTFAEITWVPTELEQAEDRTWRIGQANAVLAYYLLFADSLDVQMMNKVVHKMDITKKAVDADDEFISG